MTDLPRFANLRDGGNLRPKPDVLINGFCIAIALLLGCAIAGFLIVLDPLGLIHAPQGAF